MAVGLHFAAAAAFDHHKSLSVFGNADIFLNVGSYVMDGWMILLQAPRTYSGYLTFTLALFHNYYSTYNYTFVQTIW